MGEAWISRRGGGAAGKGLPTYTYTGESQFTDDGDNNWTIKFLTGGDFAFTSLGGTKSIDIFCVGGGAGGSAGGGAGGYTNTVKSAVVTKKQTYPVVVGAGGAGARLSNYRVSSNGTSGGESSFGSILKAAGGVYAKQDYDNHAAGRGGSGGGGYRRNGSSAGSGGSDGSDGKKGEVGKGGIGQKSQAGPNGEAGSTRAFGEADGELFSGGGAGAGGGGTAGAGGGGGKANTGGGGNGSESGAAGAGGSGIVIIRNHREAQSDG